MKIREYRVDYIDSSGWTESAWFETAKDKQDARELFIGQFGSEVTITNITGHWFELEAAE
jgi:hypothetical protein